MTTLADARQLPPNLASDVQKLAPGSIVEMFTLDTTAIGGPIHHFHTGVNNLLTAVVFGGVVYAPWPIEASGFELTGSGSLPTPRVKVANITETISSLCKSLDDLVGARVVRRRTFAKYLDAVNFPGGVNPSADPNAKFPDEIWFVARKTGETNIFVEFDLKSSMDVHGVKLPRRQVIANCCTWRYRGPECGYTGTNWFDLNDAPTSPSTDQCSKRLNACKLRHGANAELPYGGFPGAGRVR